MSKIKRFLDQTSEIRNGDRLTACVCILLLGGIGFVLNEKLYKSKIECIDKTYELSELELENKLLKNELGYGDQDNQDEMFE